MATFPSDPAAARAELLRRLPGVGFVPPPEWRDAAVGRGKPTDETLTADVEAFVAAFWTLAPTDRRERWRSLVEVLPIDLIHSG